MSEDRDAAALHILVVDDHLTNQMVVKHQLERKGHQVVIAGDGQEAVALCETQRFDLVFMDVQMPIMDGIEATRKIRAGTVNRGVPIIAVTAGAEFSLHRDCMAAGMSSVITKPLLFDQLSSVLEGVRSGAITGAVQAVNAEREETSRFSESPLDFGVFIDRLDGDEIFAQQLIDGFLQQNERLLSQMSENLRKGEWDSLRTSAHTIKGGALNLAAGDLHRAAEALENAGNADPKQRDRLLSELMREHDRLRRFAERRPWLDY